MTLAAPWESFMKFIVPWGSLLADSILTKASEVPLNLYRNELNFVLGLFTDPHALEKTEIPIYPRYCKNTTSILTKLLNNFCSLAIRALLSKMQN